MMMTEEEIRSFLAGGDDGEAGVKKIKFPSLEPARSMDGVKTGLSHLEDVRIEISVELGRATLRVGDVLGLTEGSVIKLEKPVGEPVEVIMNSQRFARGEVVVINDSFGIRIASINKAQKSRLSEGMV